MLKFKINKMSRFNKVGSAIDGLRIETKWRLNCRNSRSDLVFTKIFDIRLS